MADLVGQQLGNYRLLRLLGSGGFADVYLGEHIYLKTQAAIKILHARLGQDDLQTFLSEARTIASLEHPHIVRVLDFGVEGATPFLVMQYAPKGTLRQRHSPGIPLVAETILPYVQQTASALQYAHDQKLVHRDVKPENLLLGRTGEILLSDFGIAVVTQTSDQGSVEGIGGTLAYMAPEQFQSQPRPASDQYSLGVVVYEWLSGERPFSGSYVEIAAKHALTPPPPLREKVPSLSADVEEVVMIALRKDPKERFASVRAFATAFEQACLGEHAPLSARPADLSTQEAPGETAPSPSVQLSPPSILSLLATQEQTPPDDGAKKPPLLSRRAVLAGLAGLTLIGGGATLLALAQQPKRPVMAGPYIYRGHKAAVISLAWSPDSTRIASASFDQTVQVWDATSGGHVVTYRGHNSQVWAVAWSPSGQQIASAGADNTVKVWDAITGSQLLTLSGHTDLVLGLAWSPDGRFLVSASYDKTARVWDAASGKSLFTYMGHTDRVWSVSWSPNGSLIASGGKDKTAQVWLATTGAPILTYSEHTGGVVSLAWAPDGERIVSGSYDKTARVWDGTTGATLGLYSGHSDLVLAVSWSPDGSFVASASQDKTVQLWDASTTRTIFTYRGHATPLRTAAWSPNGAAIASASDDALIQVWRTPALPLATPTHNATILPAPTPTGTPLPGSTEPPTATSTLGLLPTATPPAVPTATPTFGVTPTPTLPH